jgi:hypothetical protein
MRPIATARAFAGLFALAAALSGCLQLDSADKAGADRGVSGIQEPIQTAGATSSTNWPQEDVGTEPVQVFGTADSVLKLTFKQPLDSTRVPYPSRLAGRIRIYRAGFIPVLDSVPSLGFAFPAMDTLRLSGNDLKPLIINGLDTLRFTVELRTDTSMCLMPGFVYSFNQGRFLGLPPILSAGGSVTFSDPHYKFAGIPDSAFVSALSDTAGNARFYYYIPGSPYFWRHSLTRDSLYIGPTVKGALPLRCLKVMTRADRNGGILIEAYPLTLAREFVNDSIRHSIPIDHFKLGSPLFRASLPNPPVLPGPD